MKCVKVTNTSKGTELARKARIASSLKDRTIGLLGTSSLPEGGGLWLSPCRSVHSFGMRYAIDVLFVGKQGQAVHQRTLAPWRITRWVPQAAGALELPAGTLARAQTRVGDRIEMKEAS